MNAATITINGEEMVDTMPSPPGVYTFTVYIYPHSTASDQTVTIRQVSFMGICLFCILKSALIHVIRDNPRFRQKRRQLL